MIIWSGFGFLVALFVLAATLAFNIAFDAALGTGYYAAHPWGFGLSLFAAAALCALTARVLNRSAARTLVDPQTGQPVVLRRRDTLFFVPIAWWTPVLVVCGAAVCTRAWLV